MLALCLRNYKTNSNLYALLYALWYILNVLSDRHKNMIKQLKDLLPKTSVFNLQILQFVQKVASGFH